jgi:hypothetical protein
MLISISDGGLGKLADLPIDGKTLNGTDLFSNGLTEPNEISYLRYLYQWYVWLLLYLTTLKTADRSVYTQTSAAGGGGISGKEILLFYWDWKNYT